jgi:hypothetical protein
MNQLMTQTPSISACAGAKATAERELNAFFTAVSDMFGAEQAELSADDWLSELTAAEVPPSSTREWRGITLRASARLAARVYPASMSSVLCRAFASVCS